MTYPPQPPGQSGPYGQEQGGQPVQHGGTSEPTRQFQAGGTQQFGQRGQDPYGRQGQRGYAPYGQQQGIAGDPGGEPPKKKTGLIIGLAIAAAVLIGGVVTLILLLTGGNDEEQEAGGLPAPGSASSAPAAPSTSGPAGSVEQSAAPSEPAAPGGSPDDIAAAREVAEQTAEAIRTRNPELAREVFCDPSAFDENQFNGIPADATIEIIGDPVIDGDTAQVPARVSESGKTEEIPVPVQRVGDRWCISD